MIVKIRKILSEKRGFSLVELLVTIAVAAVLIGLLGLFVAQGTSIFRKQSSNANLQNEAQLINGQLEEALMEAKAIYIYTPGHGMASTNTTIIYTGEYDASSGVYKWLNPTGTERTILCTGNKLYITSECVSSASGLSDGYMVTGYIDTYEASIDASSIEAETNSLGQNIIYKYKNPVVINLSIVLKDEENTKAADMTIRIRNRIERIVYE